MIELLIVVAIIGVLAAVGIPMYNGYIVTAKENATKENHNRIRDFIAASFYKCTAGNQYIVLKSSPTGTSNRPCSSSMQILVTWFAVHFEHEGFKNPYDTSDKAVYINGGTPRKGQTFIFGYGNTKSH